MTCFFPLTAWKSNDLDDVNLATGKTRMVFRKDAGLPSTETQLPCGQCIGCRMDRSRSWAARIMNEAQLHEKNCFVTLTYNEKHIGDGSLNKRDMQLFMKKLRKRNPDIPIRYFQCGEYGTQLGRRHHHAILFGYYPEDAVFFRRLNGNNLYLSRTIADCWPHGLHSIGELTVDSAMYVAKYVTKKITGKDAEEHYQGKKPEFVTMSLKPGIGKEFYNTFKGDIYNHDKMVISNDFITRPPKYYDRMHELHFPDEFAAIKAKRRDFASSHQECEERLQIRNKLAHIKTKEIKRSYEEE